MKSFIIIPCALAFAIITANAEPNHAADIKPALAKEGFDKDELRLVKVIHKRILEQEKSDSKKLLAPYKQTLKSGVNLDMLPIKSGSFTWQGEQADDTLDVTLSAFWMSKKEILWDDYNPFMHPKVARIKNGQLPEIVRSQVEDDIDFIARPTPQYNPITRGMPKDGKPTVSMSQHAANKYCQWLSYQTGHFYRLPTEAEWEYACRAGTKTKYSWGDDPAEAKKYAWFGGNSRSDYHNPGLKKPNPWGLYDMHGNVQEWTLDQYVPNRRKYFAKSKVINPWVKATEPYPHVTKGGNWKHPIAKLTSAQRLPSQAKWKGDDPQGPKSIWYHTDAQMVGLRIVRPEKIPTAEEMYHYWNSGVAKDGDHAFYNKR